MDEIFDDMFGGMFDDDNLKPMDKARIKEELDKIIEMFGKFINDNDNNPNDIPKLINHQDVELSEDEINEIEQSFDNEPDNIEFYEKDNLYYEKRTWMLPNGQVTEVIVSDIPLRRDNQINKIDSLDTLKLKLNKAVKEEDYEQAVVFRNKITELTKNTKLEEKPIKLEIKNTKKRKPTKKK